MTLQMKYQEKYEQGIKQGIRQGIEQGVKRGIEQGVQQEIEKGIVKGNRQSALRMMESEKFTLEEIAMYSGLTLEEVKELEKKISQCS